MINLRFGFTRHVRENGNVDIQFQFRRFNTVTNEDDAAGTHRWNNLNPGKADKLLKALNDHQAERMGAAKKHPAPDTSEAGILKWDGIAESIANDIEQHLWDGVVKVGKDLLSAVHAA